MNSKESIKLPISIKLAVLLLTALVAVLFYLVLRPDSASQLSNSLASSISIRQNQDNIQWKLPGSDWQTITTVSDLTAGVQGRPGKDGKDGKDGTDGQDGQNGTNGQNGAPGAQGATGATGSAGQNGTNGTDGVDGAQGIQGIQGEQGEQGIQGIAGANGQDGQDGIDGANGTDGTDGREIELQKDLYYIQWRYVGEPGWRNLIAYSDLKGEKGDTGATGPANSLSIGTVDRTTCTPTASITGTAPSQTLNLGIPGLLTGGTAGQVLQKKSNTDCDVEWRNSGPQLLREIVWSGNDVARPIAVDEATGIFTAPGHTLRASVGGTAMVTFRDGEVDYLPKYMPGGFPLNVNLHYQPVDADHFYLANSNGGPAITYTNNPTMDLSKIQFEQNNMVPWTSGLSQYTISGLGDRRYARVEIIGKNSLRYVHQGNKGETFTGNGDIYGSMNIGGFAYARSTVIIDTTGHFLTLTSDVKRWNYNNASSFTFATSGMYTMNPGKPAEPFNRVVLDNGIIANGTIVRVWSE